MAISSVSYIFHLLDSGLPSGQREPPFEQLGPENNADDPGRF